MEDSRFPRSRSRAPRSVRDEDDSESFGCFGLRFRSMSPAHNHRDQTPRPRFDPPRSVAAADTWESVPQAQGFAISGKSAEILGIVPKGAPLTPPKSRTSSPLAWRSASDSAYANSKEPSIASSKSSVSVPAQFQKKAPADPLIVVRRRLKQEAAAATANSRTARSSSAPAPTRNYSRKWRRSERFSNMEHSPPPGNDFFDTESRDNSIEEEEIPDNNKFDSASKTFDVVPSADESSVRIQSAAMTTFAWMTLQEEAASLLNGTASDRGRSSWLLDTVTSPGGNVANESKKRSGPATQSGESSPGFAKRDDKRDTLEWMGVNPRDFPTPIATV